MHPVNVEDGYSNEVVLDERQTVVEDMRAVLMQGAIIGAVRRGADRSHYLVSTGLARYFAVAQKKRWTVQQSELERKELVNVIGVALLPTRRAMPTSC